MKRIFYRQIAIAFVLFACNGFSAYAQDASLQQQFTAFNTAHPQEKLFVHTDKNFYLVGEIVWFRLYDDKKDHLSKVAYIDLLDASGKTVLNAKISLKPSENNGSLLLPLSLNSGTYILRSYTNWMKNTAAMSFFEKTITVVNPFKSPDTTLQKHAAGYEANFFPEGGNMVKGLASVVGVKVNDRYGKGIDCSGYVLNSKNEKVASFSTLKFGLGKFVFTPVENNYKAVIILPDGSSITRELPAVSEKGYVMTVSAPGENFMVELRSAYTGPQNVYLYAQSGQVLRLAESRIMEDGKTVFTVPKNKLGNGVVQFTAFNAVNQPVCERLVFIRPAKTTLVTAAADRKEYANRRKVEVAIATKNASGQPIAADMSLSVFPADSLQDIGKTDIESYYWLASEVKGYIESPSWYFSEDPLATDGADNLMLTQGWRRFNWSNIMGKAEVPVHFLPEVAGHYVTVEVTDVRNNQPAQGKEVYLSVPGKPFEFLASITDNNGHAQFDTKELYGLKKVIVQVNSADTNAFKIELLSPFSRGTAQSMRLPFYLSASPAQLEEYSINMQVQNIYNADSMRMFYAHEQPDTIPFYGRASYYYNLDDYKRFTTMEEVLREYVREITVVARNGQHYLRIIDEPRHEYNEDNLLVLWDGVPLRNPHNIFRFDPLKVKRLEVIPRRYAAGESIFNGIASFSTYNADLSGYPINQGMLAVDYEGMQLQREFYSPTYITANQVNSRIPDFRNTLYWSPYVFTTAKGEAKAGFYTGDRKGKYVGVLQGVDSNGYPIVTTFGFEVK